MKPASLDWETLYARFTETERDRKMRKASTLRAQGLSFRKIAVVVGVSKDTVRQWIINEEAA